MPPGADDVRQQGGTVTGPALSCLLALAAALAIGAVTSCGGGDPPPTSPLAETPSPPRPASPTPVALASPTPTAAPATSTPTPTPPPAAPAPAPTPAATPSPPAIEIASARAVALMAEWLDVAVAALGVERAEEVVWPSRCIGIERPGTLCSDALTPGYLVRLNDRAGGAHTLHMRGAGGGVEWAGEERFTGVVVFTDGPGSLLIIAVDGVPTPFRIVPGSTRLNEDPGASTRPEAVAVGAEVEFAVDPNPRGDGPAVIAWLVDLT